MEPYQVDFIIGALFMIVSAIFCVNDRETVSYIWSFVALCFMINGIYDLINNITSVCYGG